MTRRSASVLLLLGQRGFSFASIEGSYKGTWTGQTANGDFFLKLEPSGQDWKASIRFTIAGNDIPAQIRELRVSGSAIETKYLFSLGDNSLQSHLRGEINDGHLTGKYTTTTADGATPVDEGTCDAKRV